MAEKQPAPDIDRLIAAVATRHHVLLKPDDAAFALVTLNQLVLEDSIKELTSHIRAATLEFVSSFERVQEHAGTALAKTHRQINVELHAEMEKCIVTLTTAASTGEMSIDYRHALLVFIAGIAVGVVLHWVG
jgi:phage-related tail fiber protein